MGSGTLALPPIGHHDFGFHDRQEENYERRSSVVKQIDAVLVENDRVRIFSLFFFLTARFLLLVMGK